MEPILVDLCPINMPKLEFRSDSDLFGDSRWLINPDMMMGEEEDFFRMRRKTMVSKAKVARITWALNMECIQGENKVTNG